jgi:starch phosphorylase
LRELNIQPSVFHLNEGHSAFLTLELAREFLAADQEATFDNAVENVREQCVFTTHTPVDAGNDVFSPDQLRECFEESYIASLKIDEQRFLQLGRTDPANETEYFGMTPLAIRMSRSANGVSKKHGEVSRALWLKMFPDLTEADKVPITHVTNGVHHSTWIAGSLQRLYSEQIGGHWPEVLGDAERWRTAITSLSDKALWDAHCSLKRLLVEFIRERVKNPETGTVETINEHRDTRSLLSPDALTIGFARRVAAYKRWDLLLTDVDRLLKMVDDKDRPVQFVFAGKAHPQDKTAKHILQHLMSINHDSNWQNRAVFIQDYDQEIARYLVQGVDVWMNVPRRPLEASGTSGEKAAMNGVLNFSILDGWWIEGFNGVNGFQIGELSAEGDDAATDKADAEALYWTLENAIIPAFYDGRVNGVPMEWIKRMKDSMATLTPQFSSDRMVRDYLSKIYRND